MALPAGKSPPYAEEIGESRIGYQSGLLGDRPAPRLFRVYTKNAIDNPIRTMETLDTVNGGERRGNIYPTRGGWSSSSGFGNFVLYVWTIVDHLIGTNVWILQADYVPFYITGLPKSAWSFRITSTVIMTPSYTERPWTNDSGQLVQRGIGAPRYILRKDLLVQETAGAPGAPPILTTYANTSKTFTATSLNPDHGTMNLQLPNDQNELMDPRSPSLPRYMTGADIPERVSVLTITKQISKWSFSEVSQAMQYLGYVNSDEFSVLTTSGQITFANAPSNAYLGQMLFTDFQCDPVLQTESALSEPAFQITMQFQYRPQGWQHMLLHTYKFEDGSEAVIKYFDPIDGLSKSMDETFHVVDPALLSNIVSAFV